MNITKKILSAGAYGKLSYDLASLVLRLFFGGLMVMHGRPKLMGFDTMSNSFPDPLQMGSHLSLIATIFTELICAGFLVLGLFTRLMLLPLIFATAVMFFIIHGNDSLKLSELSLLYLVVYCVLFFMGAGRFSLDHYMFKK